jgi:hypothetical protein
MEEISPLPAKILFASEEVKNQEIGQPENPFKKLFLVDVQAKAAEGKVRLYQIFAVKGRSRQGLDLDELNAARTASTWSAKSELRHDRSRFTVFMDASDYFIHWWSSRSDLRQLLYPVLW